MTPQEMKEKEAAFVRRFLLAESDLYAWFRAHLTVQRAGLARLAGRLGLSSEDRALLVGKLSVIEDLLDTPERLLTIAEKVEEQVEAEYRRAPAPLGSPSVQ